MEKLANLTQADINNGILDRMLYNVGISDVQEYVNNFNQETEQIIIEEFEHPEKLEANLDQTITTPTEIKHWTKHLQLRLDDDPVPKPPAATPVPESKPQDLKSWMKGMVPDSMMLPPENVTPATTVTKTTDNESSVKGNLGDWLIDWSKQINEQPPPTSLDTWLKGLIPTDVNESLAGDEGAKVRLNTYLNAAQKVLSEHGYDVSHDIKVSPEAQKKLGVLGNVKEMYFLWKVLDKNNDRKITVEDVQIMLEEMGLGFISKYVAKTLFDMVDTNHDGQLQFRDFIALMSIIKALVGAVGSAKS